MLGACAGQTAGTAGPAPVAAGAAAIRAQPGDTVYLVEHHVRSERREQFEDFVEQVLWPALHRTAESQPARRAVLPRLRLLRPLQPDADGAWTYTFVLDPVVVGERYDVLAMLRDVYPEDEAVRQYTRFTETWAREFTSRAFVQHRDPGG